MTWCIVCGQEVDSVYETGDCCDCFDAVLQQNRVLSYGRMVLPEILKAGIPAGDYFWAMKAIQDAALKVVHLHEIGNEEAEAKIKSFCEAFMLLHFSSIMHMKAGELNAGAGNSENGESWNRHSQSSHFSNEHTI